MKLGLFVAVVGAVLFLVTGQGQGQGQGQVGAQDEPEETKTKISESESESGQRSNPRVKRASQRIPNAGKTINIQGRHFGVRHFGVGNPQDLEAVKKFVRIFKEKFEEGSGNLVHMFPKGGVEAFNLRLLTLQREIGANSAAYEWELAGENRKGEKMYNLMHKNGGLVELLGDPTNGASIFNRGSKTIRIIDGEVVPRFVIGTTNPFAHKVEASLHFSG